MEGNPLDELLPWARLLALAPSSALPSPPLLPPHLPRLPQRALTALSHLLGHSTHMPTCMLTHVPKYNPTTQVQAPAGLHTQVHTCMLVRLQKRPHRQRPPIHTAPPWLGRWGPRAQSCRTSSARLRAWPALNSAPDQNCPPKRTTLLTLRSPSLHPRGATPPRLLGLGLLSPTEPFPAPRPGAGRRVEVREIK